MSQLYLRSFHPRHRIAHRRPWSGTATGAILAHRRQPHLVTAGWVVAGLCAMAIGLAISAAPAGATTPTGATSSSTSTEASHAGTLTATGVCPFDDEYDTFGQSWPGATYSGTLTGFAPKTTYYVYDDNDVTSGYTPAPVTSTILISISTEHKPYLQSPPAGQVYRPRTTLMVNPPAIPGRPPEAPPSRETAPLR